MTEFPAQVNWVYLQTAAAENDSAAESGPAAGDGREHSEPAAEISPSKLLCNIRGIIFDFDGTLFDNARLPFHLIAAWPPDWLRIWRERLVRKNFAGRDYSSPNQYFRAFFNALGKICFRSPERIRNWYFDHYMPRMIRVLKKHYKPRPGAWDLLKRMDALVGAKSGKCLRAAVYSDYPLLKERLEALGLYPSERILLYGPESFGAQKPAMRPYRQIAADLEIPPEEILVIGDREDTDGLGAFHAGMRFFCLETGRKRYYRLDPNRRRVKEEPHGPTLVMYAGAWDDVVKLLMSR